jgi:hypothetical protein
LSEDTGSALKAGVKVCQRNLINEVPPLVTAPRHDARTN